MPNELTAMSEREAKIRREWMRDPTHREMFAIVDATRAALQKAEEALALRQACLEQSTEDISKMRQRLAQVEEIAREMLDWIVKRGTHQRDCCLGNCVCKKQDVVARATALLGEPRSAEREEQ